MAKQFNIVSIIEAIIVVVVTFIIPITLCFVIMNWFGVFQV